MFKELILKNRSYRRFYEDFKISKETLYELIDYARLSPSPRNQQALKFIISNDKKLNCNIFEQLAWAGAIENWDGPEKGERPSAYIVILGDNSIIKKGTKAYHEAAYGIAAQSITLGAVANDLGACMIAAIKRKPLRELFNIPKELEILLVIAVGKPKEEIKIEEMPKDGNYDYWRDKKNIHHVPKRSLEEIIIK